MCLYETNDTELLLLQTCNKPNYVGDFGIAKVLDGTMAMAMTVIGTPYYMSPEIYDNKPYSYKSDSWALGCILYEMATQRHAFDAKSLSLLAQKVMKGKYAPLPGGSSSTLQKLVRDLLQASPARRPSMAQILQKEALRTRINLLLEPCYGITSKSISKLTAGKDTPMSNLCLELRSLGINPPAPESEDVQRKVTQTEALNPVPQHM